MKFILAFVVAILFLPCIPDTAQSQTRKKSASSRSRKPTKRPAKVVAPPSPIGTTSSGLIYVITRRGDGRQPVVGETVFVHYTGMFTSGVKFDSSLDKGRPYAFQLGAGHVIKGWDEGIAKLRVGDQAALVIPSSLGYGPQGRGPIPPDATLVFIVELVGIQEKPPAD